MSGSLFNSATFKVLLLIAVLLVLASIPFMASVASEFQVAASAVAGLVTLLVVVDSFKGLGGR